MVVGSRFYRSGIEFFMRVLGAVMRGDRDASPLPLVSRVVD
jgi:hypothetical protein